MPRPSHHYTNELPCKFVLIDICVANDQQPVAAITMGRSEVERMFYERRQNESWRLAYRVFERHEWEPGNAMQLPGGAGWLFSVHRHVEL